MQFGTNGHYADAAHIAGMVREVLDEAGIIELPQDFGRMGNPGRGPDPAEWDLIEVHRVVIALAREVQLRVRTGHCGLVEAGPDERVFVDSNHAAAGLGSARPMSPRDPACPQWTCRVR